MSEPFIEKHFEVLHGKLDRLDEAILVKGLVSHDYSGQDQSLRIRT
ncbi:MAG: hypothetical protein K8S55_08550 [Phycisphaerae bacterium]|nr:hypothetical protein [Phycisphaerae bacterium]